MPKYSEILGPEVCKRLNEGGIKLGRKAVRAVLNANSAGLSIVEIQTSILDAASLTRPEGKRERRKIGSFGLSGRPINSLKERAFREGYEQALRDRENRLLARRRR